MKPKTEEQALLQLTALCSQSEHCTHEMREKLQRWGVMEDAQQRIIDYLIDERYVDDGRFCRAFLREKMEYNGWGRRKIEQALWMKRIPKALSKEAFEEVTHEQWVERLRPLLVSKRRSVRADSDYELNQKLFRFALGRGFSYDEIRDCLDTDVDIDVEDGDFSDDDC